jgi:integrase
VSHLAETCHTLETQVLVKSDRGFIRRVYSADHHMLSERERLREQAFDEGAAETSPAHVVPHVVESPVSRPMGLALRLALLTGLRVGEIAGITMDEIHDVDDDAKAHLLITGSRIKNGRDHVVPCRRSRSKLYES